MKRALIIAGIVLTFLLLGAGAFWYFGGPGSGEDGGGFDNSPFGTPPEEEDGSGLQQLPPETEEDNRATSSARSQNDGPGDFARLATDISGYAVFENEQGSTTVRYMKKSGGAIEQMLLESGETTTITDPQIPRVHESFWGARGEAVIARYYDDEQQTIKSYLMNLSSFKEEVDDYEIDGQFLDDGVRDVAISPSGNRAALLESTESGSIISRISFPAGSTAQIFSSQYSAWNIDWPASGSLALFPRASGAADGYLYRLAIGDPQLEKLSAAIPGLTALASPNFDHVIYSESSEGSFSTYLYDVSEDEVLTQLPEILPEKCVWQDESIFYCAVPENIPEGQYPDNWYQGQVQFDDQIVQMNADTQQIAERFEFDEEMDAIRLKRFGDYVYFMSKDGDGLYARHVEP